MEKKQLRTKLTLPFITVILVIQSKGTQPDLLPTCIALFTHCNYCCVALLFLHCHGFEYLLANSVGALFSGIEFVNFGANIRESTRAFRC